MLTPDELAAMRACQEANLSGTCKVKRKERTANATGTWSEGTSAAGTYTYRLDVSRETERQKGGKLAASASMIITLPWNADVRHDDELELEDGRILQVLGATSGGSDVTARRFTVQEAT